MRWRAVAVAAALAAYARPARAGGPIGPNGAPITTSAYAVDLSEGPVLAGTRVVGLAGAYVAIAEGTDGNSQNPAAPAVRAADSFAHVDWDAGLGLTYPSAIAHTDFFNTGVPGTNLGQTDTGSFLFLDLSGNLQVGPWGFGVTINGQTYAIDRTAPTSTEVTRLGVEFVTGHLLVARAMSEGQVVVGGGARFSNLAVTDRNSGDALFGTTGAAFEGGLLVRPNDQPFRIGVSLRSELIGADTFTGRAPDAAGDRVLGDPASGSALYLPRAVALPWDVSFGLAVQLGPRPFNPRFLDPAELLEQKRRYLAWRARERARRAAYQLRRAAPSSAARRALEADDRAAEARDRLELERAEREVRAALVARYRAAGRFRVLLTGSLTVSGKVADGVGVESFLTQRVERSGETGSLTPRFAVESEVVPGWVGIRAGTYYEPTRFSTPRAAARLHGTVGLDARLFSWTVFGLFGEGTAWRISGAFDRAARYSGWSVAIGTWR